MKYRLVLPFVFILIILFLVAYFIFGLFTPKNPETIPSSLPTITPFPTKSNSFIKTGTLKKVNNSWFLAYSIPNEPMANIKLNQITGYKPGDQVEITGNQTESGIVEVIQIKLANISPKLKSDLPQTGSAILIDWPSVTRFISQCQTQKIIQNQDKKVVVFHKNGLIYSSIQPKIDEVTTLSKQSIATCGQIDIVTE